MKLYKYAAALLLLLGMAMTGCSDSDKWTPGPQDTNIGVCAYFEIPTTTSYIFGSDYDDEDMVITVPVGRQDTNGAATVGLIMKSDVEGFSCPATIDFADGEAETSFTISCGGIPKGAIYNVAVELAPDQTDTYGEGLIQINFTAIKADWKVASDRARYIYSDGDKNIYPSTYGELLQLEGIKIFKLTDFFGSGLDMTFECKTPDETVFMPRENADFENVADEDKEDNGWYLYDDATSSYPSSWVPGGLSGYKAMSYLLFYADKDLSYNGCNMLYNEKTLYGYIWFTVGVDFDDDSFKWGSFQIDFTLKYNPFAEDKNENE